MTPESPGHTHASVPPWRDIRVLRIVAQVVVLLASLLTAGLDPGTYPLWGAVHLRVWAAQKIMMLSPLGVLSGSPWAETYLRLAGARVGFDLLSRRLLRGDRHLVQYVF